MKTDVTARRTVLLAGVAAVLAAGRLRAAPLGPHTNGLSGLQWGMSQDQARRLRPELRAGEARDGLLWAEFHQISPRAAPQDGPAGARLGSLDFLRTDAPVQPLAEDGQTTLVFERDELLRVAFMGRPHALGAAGAVPAFNRITTQLQQRLGEPVHLLAPAAPTRDGRCEPPTGCSGVAMFSSEGVATLLTMAQTGSRYRVLLSTWPLAAWEAAMQRNRSAK